jgi:hypothetical protein
MHDPTIVLSGIVAVLTGAIDQLFPRRAGPVPDRGAVSIEQVLWYAAAAVSVAVVAAIIWSQIRDTASTPVQSPSAP